MADRKTRGKSVAQAVGGRTKAGMDRSFGENLRTKSIDRIVPDAINRFEVGRRLYAQQGTAAAAAELELLVKERQRLEEEGDDKGPKHARLDRLITAINADVEAGRMLLAEIEHAVVPVPGGWTVIGRVMGRDGTVPKKVEVLFLGDNNEPVKELKSVKLGTDGMVRQVYPADVVKRLAEKSVRVVIAVRVGGRIVAAEQTGVRIRPNHVHQFDLRIDSSIAL